MQYPIHRLDSIETSLARSRATHPDAASLRAVITRSWRSDDLSFPLFQSDSRTFDASELVESECFSAATILDLCAESMDASTRRGCRESLEHALVRGGDLVHFFRSRRLPLDSDSTSLTGLALSRLGALDRVRARAIATRMLAHRTPEGMLSVYFDPGGERAARTDEVVTCQVLRFAGVAGVLDHTRADIAQIRAALGRGTRYYPADVLLLVAARLVRARPDVASELEDDVKHALRARLEEDGSALELSCRAAAALHLGIERVRAIAIVLSLRELPVRAEPFFWLGRRVSYFGSEALTASFRLHALGLLGTLGAVT